MDRAIFAIVAVSLYSFELYVSFTKDSTMFAWLSLQHSSPRVRSICFSSEL